MQCTRYKSKIEQPRKMSKFADKNLMYQVFTNLQTQPKIRRNEFKNTLYTVCKETKKVTQAMVCLDSFLKVTLFH